MIQATLLVQVPLNFTKGVGFFNVVLHTPPPKKSDRVPDVARAKQHAESQCEYRKSIKNESLGLAAISTSQNRGVETVPHHYKAPVADSAGTSLSATGARSNIVHQRNVDSSLPCSFLVRLFF